MSPQTSRRVGIARVAVALVALLVLGYLGVIGYLVANETSIVFFADAAPGSRRPAMPFEQVASPRDDGGTQLTWVMRQASGADRAPWIVFLHGKGAPVSARLNIVHYERLRALGLNVVAPEYRGYSGTGGVPTEAAVERDARSGYDYLVETLHVPSSRIVIFGWSLGSAVAVDLASHVPSAGVILEGAPSSLVDIGRLRYPLIPIRLVMRNPFNSMAKIGNVKAPLLFLHSPEDAVVPIDEGRRLFAAAHDPKEFVQVRGGHVYAAERDPRFFEYVRRFLAERKVIAGQMSVASQ
jgi:pimeloyl-ACP methyl ester carboxylesterase